MKLLVVRHAIAEDREAFARRGDGGDHQRPLSKKGRRRFRRGAKALAALVPEVDLLLSSPLVRAVQTADLLEKALRKEGTEPLRRECPALVPGAHPRALGEWLGEWLGDRAETEGDAGPPPRTVAVVGHEPHLSHLVSWLTAGSERSWIRLKKGSGVLLRLPGSKLEPGAGPDTFGPGTATMLWALAPRQLRELAD